MRASISGLMKNLVLECVCLSPRYICCDQCYGWQCDRKDGTRQPIHDLQWDQWNCGVRYSDAGCLQGTGGIFSQSAGGNLPGVFPSKLLLYLFAALDKILTAIFK